MKATSALGAGLAGASAVTIIHETVKKATRKAPRMDLLGMNALSKIIKKANGNVPNRKSLFAWTLAGDLLANTLYYSLSGVGRGKGVWWRGPALGFLAGLGAVLLPRPLGLQEGPSNRTTATKVMTVAWYLAGGLVSAAVARFLMPGKEKGAKMGNGE